MLRLVFGETMKFGRRLSFAYEMLKSMCMTLTLSNALLSTLRSQVCKYFFFFFTFIFSKFNRKFPLRPRGSLRAHVKWNFIFLNYYTQNHSGVRIEEREQQKIFIATHDRGDSNLMWIQFSTRLRVLLTYDTIECTAIEYVHGAHIRRNKFNKILIDTCNVCACVFSIDSISGRHNWIGMCILRANHVNTSTAKTAQQIKVKQ